jgi:hypothetical protein
MNKPFIIILLAALAGCNAVTFTEKENNAAQRVMNFYEGTGNKMKHISIKNSVKENIFELEIGQSKMLEDMAGSTGLEMPASNIACMIYSGLEDEQENYTHVNVKINLENKQSHEYKFTAADLKEIEKLKPILSAVTEKLKNKDYAGLLKEFDDSIVHLINLKEIEKGCKEIDSANGDIKMVQFHGFSFFKSETQEKEMVHLASLLDREKTNTPLSLIIARGSGKLYGLKFSF